MNKIQRIAILAVSLILAAGVPALLVKSAFAHCDTENGPVAVAACKALETGKFESVAIWVGVEQEDELRTRFQECLTVYRMDGEEKKLAERYFMETAVRLHRAAEGMTYTGLKPAQPLPEDIAAAEKALETGDLKPLISLLSTELEQQLRGWFQNASDAKKHKDESINAGREWVNAYVEYVIYVHGLHETILGGPEHGVGHVE